MKRLAEAIANRANNDQALMEKINNEFHFEKQPEGTTLPYCRFVLISQVPDYDHDIVRPIENTLWQIDSFSRSALEVLEVAGEVQRVFDNAQFEIEGYNLLRCERQSSDLIYESENGIYHYYSEYRIYVD